MRQVSRKTDGGEINHAADQAADLQGAAPLMGWEWSDLRFFLAVARHGTTLQAAHALGVNQTTCARRLAALERDLGITLFERTPRGYSLTALGAALVAQAEAAEAGALAFERSAREKAQSQRSLIRFTTNDSLAEQFAQAAVAEFSRLRPDIRIALEVDHRTADLAGGEADVALRAADSLTGDTLIARKVGETPWALYCSADYAQRVGGPSGMDEIGRHPLATLAGAPAAALRALAPDATIAFSTNSMSALVEAIAAGECVGAMPRTTGDSRPQLRLCFAMEGPPPGLWIVYPERLRGEPNIRAFVDHLAAHVQAWLKRGSRAG